MHFQPEQVPKLKSLTLAQVVTSSAKLEQLVQKIVKWEFRDFNLSYNPGTSGSLSLFLSHALPPLKSLILRHCKLHAGDMESLARANVQGKFPELDYLDVSENSCTFDYLKCDPSSGREVTWKNV